jgi:hypothetical protein
VINVNDRLKWRVYLWENDIESITDPFTTRNRNEGILDSLLMIDLIGLEWNVTEIAVSDFRDTSPHKVVKVEGNGSVRYGFVARGRSVSPERSASYSSYTWLSGRMIFKPLGAS